MAIYHCSIKIISRSSGRSAVASAAYRAGEKLLNDETGILHDFTRKGGVVMSEILLPEHVPDAFSDRQILWNEVQKTERRSDAQLAREVEVAFPVEMKRSQQIECIRDYIQENFVSEGMIADWALHDKGDGNPHAHIMLTVRGFDENQHWQQKTKTVFANTRDAEGRPVFDPTLPSYDPKDREHTSQYRIPQLDENGMQKTRIRKGKGTEYLWEKITIPANDWNDRQNAEKWRASWAQHCNLYLEKEKQIDHRSYARQGLDREPTIHEGVTARNMELAGMTADRCQINREVRDRNSIREQIRKLTAELTAAILKKARELYERFTHLAGAVGDREETGRHDRTDGNASVRKRKSDQGTGRLQKEASAEIEEAERIRRIEREVEQRKPAIASADRKLEQLAALIRERKMKNEERIKKLMERRRTAHTAGGGTGSDRSASGQGRWPDPGDQQEERTDHGTEAGKLIRDIEDAISAATGAEKDSRAERSDREAERRRLDFERQREAEERERAHREREREAREQERQDYERSRSRGRSR